MLLSPATGYPVRGNFVATSTGDNCYSLWMIMADPQNHGQCASNQAKYRNACCNAAYSPPAVAQAPAAVYESSIPQGNEPWCDICPGGGYPTKNQILAIRYMQGTPSCKTLYEMGRRGLPVNDIALNIDKIRGTFGVSF